MLTAGDDIELDAVDEVFLDMAKLIAGDDIDIDGTLVGTPAAC